MRLLLSLALFVIILPAPASAECVSFAWPVVGEVTGEFAPSGRYSGHWGMDIDAPAATPVQAAAGGVVSFSGEVVGNQTITVSHGGGLKTSYSYLSERVVTEGMVVGSGATLGSSGIAHETEALHFSVRVFSTYRDPQPFFGCMKLIPADGLRLVG